jgi:galactarate dehydratase
MIQIIKINPLDNVAIPISDVPEGTLIADGLTALDSIPQGHKIALEDMKKGQALIRYGVTLGYLNKDVSAGNWINEHMVDLPEAPGLDKMSYRTNIVKELPAAPLTEFEGYEIPGAPFAGTRNILAVMPTVQCVSGVLNVAIQKMKSELLPRYPNVDDIILLNHAYGCGVAINAPEAKIPIRALRNLLHNPNFGGEIMAVGLGCEKFTMKMLLEDSENTKENVIILQEIAGFRAMVDALMAMAEKKLQKLNTRKRSTLPLEKLCIGMQCGGSDAFSGITANPAAGYAGDLLVQAGGTVLFSEVTEVRDGAQMLIARCMNADTAEKLVHEMKWYDAYLEAGGTDRSANPAPGNKQGGLANIMEKAMGSIAKSGTAPIVEALSPGELPSQRGLIFAATPASDFVCGTMQLSSGITLQVFMTGRGTPYGLAAAPVIKVSSRSVTKNRWNDLIDINAGTIAEGTETIEEAGKRLFAMIIDTASGYYKPWAEKYGLHNDLCIFNPAPIT